MAMLFIKPAPGMRIRDHVYPHLFIPEGGVQVPEHPYWWRKILRRDVLICDPPLETKADAHKAKPAKEV